jgi:hypothetical protein
MTRLLAMIVMVVAADADAATGLAVSLLKGSPGIVEKPLCWEPGFLVLQQDGEWSMVYEEQMLTW